MATMTDLELVSNGSSMTASTYKLKWPIASESTDATSESEKKQKFAINSTTSYNVNNFF